MEEKIYKKLYYHAFNYLTTLSKEIEQMQEDLEDMYLEAQDYPEGKPEQ